jgi:hypothetical protein
MRDLGADHGKRSPSTNILVLHPSSAGEVGEKSC